MRSCFPLLCMKVAFSLKKPSPKKGGLTFPSYILIQLIQGVLCSYSEFSSMDSDDEETKRASRIVAFTQLDQVASDFALAIALQEQERRAFTTLLPTIFQTNSDELESDSSDETDDDEDSDDDSNDFFPNSHETEEGLEFLEGEGSNSDQDMEEDDIDPDQLSYEELIALGEIVGEESRGLSMEEISASLRPYTCHSLRSKTLVDRCVICQVEYEEEEKLVALPCEHPYHADCITKWLQIKKTCPICSTEVSSLP
ncbi:E3 ubiquitin ligase BIG BROTHER-related [Vitis riparia]|uniref:E3 ubiquitin ligase BIG BROTHER-related n=1 Tax=Vitis riparia TaxID=96939 RepID=UPI00155AECD9|nr:E3 ubiquitin ligase BIG BROTHER-related [Vitis riparia]